MVSLNWQDRKACMRDSGRKGNDMVGQFQRFLVAVYGQASYILSYKNNIYNLIIIYHYINKCITYEKPYKLIRVVRRIEVDYNIY